jgi:phosphatidate cytidylyltransferase
VDGLVYLLLVGMLVEWFNMNKKTVFQSLKGISIFLSGALYIAIAVGFLLSWRHQPGLILWLLSIVWATDIGAYFVGSYFGGPKLAPRISPRKTWSGFVGGTVFGMVAGWALSSYAGVAIPLSLFGTLLIVSVAAQIGDLIESGVKRYFDVKDSGNIIPGHGGLLDRLDSLLLVAIFYKLLLILVKL